MNRRSYKGKETPNWKGGRIVSSAGYTQILRPEHHRAGSDGYIFEHILIVEKAMGKELLHPHKVHHVDGKIEDNKNKNLVVCEDQAYHLLLHKRKRALSACGNPNWRKCRFCKRWDDPGNMYVSPDDSQASHRECHNKYEKESRKQAKALM